MLGDTVAMCVGCTVGTAVGAGLGWNEGMAVGRSVGVIVGEKDGTSLGVTVGTRVGGLVGVCEYFRRMTGLVAGKAAPTLDRVIRNLVWHTHDAQVLQRGSSKCTQLRLIMWK